MYSQTRYFQSSLAMLLPIFEVTNVLNAAAPDFTAPTINFAIVKIPYVSFIVIFEEVSPLPMKKPPFKLAFIEASIAKLKPPLTLLLSMYKIADVS